MRIAEIIGTVTLNRSHASFTGARLKLALPLRTSDLRGETRPDNAPLVLWDELGAGSAVASRLAKGVKRRNRFCLNGNPLMLTTQPF